MDASRPLAAVLIVNESAEITEMLVAALNTLADCPAILAVATPYPISLLHTLPLRLILLHLSDTQLDRFQHYAALQADPILGRIPVILLTGRAEDRALRRRGYTNFICRAFELDRLLPQITTILRLPGSDNTDAVPLPELDQAACRSPG